MPTFKYEALDSQGVGIKDEVEALSEKEAISKIRNMGYFPTKVRVHGAGRKVAAKVARPARRRGAGGKVRVKLITQFARQLSTLQDAGLPILRSLRILQEQEKAGTFKRVIGYVADDIEGGSTLSEALGRFPRAFNRLLVSMVAAGETGGVLDLILSRVADFMEKAQKLKSRVISAMVYPIVVLSAAFIILLLLMTFVIPQFKSVLEEMLEGEKLHVVTRTVLGISGWIAYGAKSLDEAPIQIYGIPIGGWAVLLTVPFVTVFLIRIIEFYKMSNYIIIA